MHDALRMHDDLHAVHADVEEPAGLDHLQPFVEEGGGINRDLAAHDPARVFQRALDGDVGEGFLRVQRPVAEGAAAGGEPEVADGGGRLVIEALEDGGVLAVHGEDADAVLAGLVHHDLAGHDEDFLRGNGDVLARANGSECGLQAGGADDGDEDDVGLGHRGELQQAFVAGVDLDLGAEGGPEFVRLRGVGERDGGGLILEGLGEEQLGVAARREAENAQAVGQVIGDLEGAGADGAGAAEEDDVFHRVRQ